MFFRDRPDGTRVNVPSFKGILPYVMRTRTESQIFFEQRIDLRRTLPFLEKVNAGYDTKRITLFHICLCAAVRTIAQRPELNLFTSGHNYYQRNEIVFSFVAKKQLSDTGEEITVKLAFDPTSTLEAVSDRIKERVHQQKTSIKNVNTSDEALFLKLPRQILRLLLQGFRFLDYFNLAPGAMLKTDPLYCSMFITNVGSVGVDSPFHHLFEWGNCPLFMAIGKIKKGQWVDEKTGETAITDVVDVTFTLDDRITDGFYCAKAVDLMIHYIENPEELETALSLTQDMSAALMLNSP